MPCFISKTSDFFEKNIRTFNAKHRNFVLKKSDVSGFPTQKCRKKPNSPNLQYFRTRHGVMAVEPLLSPSKTWFK